MLSLSAFILKGNSSGKVVDKTIEMRSVAANETGMGAGLAADTEAVGSEALVALL